MPVLLHVGCGAKDKSALAGFDTPDWQEIRLDADEKVTPDIAGNLANISHIQNASIDAVYCAHHLHYYYAHEVPMALKEIHRVLKPDGFMVLTAPDLQALSEFIIAGHLMDALYYSPSGSTTPLDILYGNRRLAAQGNALTPKTGFSWDSFCEALQAAEFKSIYGGQQKLNYSLVALVMKNPIDEDERLKLAERYLP